VLLALLFPKKKTPHTYGIVCKIYTVVLPFGQILQLEPKAYNLTENALCERVIEMLDKPLVVHEDRTVYLHEWLDAKGTIGQQLTDFADIIQAPEEVFTFKLSPYALWSAAAKGLKTDYVIDILQSYSLNVISESLKGKIRCNIEEFNTIQLSQVNGKLLLQATSQLIINKLKNDEAVAAIIIEEPTITSLLFDLEKRVYLKKALFRLELFAVDSSTQCPGEILELLLKNATASGPLELKSYQKEAVERFTQFSPTVGGGGVIIMPPNSGKTLVGLKLIETLKTSTLVLVENLASGNSWLEEIEDKTDLADNSVVILHNEQLISKPITICTYKNATENSEILNHLQDQNWGLVIYDDAHKLPAGKYDQTTNISSKFKVAFVSTLARYDEKGNIVFELVGPKWYEVLPRTLESGGYLKAVRCVEVKVPFSESDKEKYLNDSNAAFRRNLSNLNPRKLEALEYIRQKSWTQQLLVVSYRDNLAAVISKMMGIPIIKTTNLSSEQIKFIEDFNSGCSSEILTTSVVEKLGIKDVNVLVATSYEKGSEREEYLRIGKVAGTGTKGAKKEGYMYSLVTFDSIEEEDYARRRKKLINYGYRYLPLPLNDLLQGRIVP
jgi:DNA excision repair protein ERCC-3